MRKSTFSTAILCLLLTALPFSALASSKNHYWMLSPNKEFSQANAALAKRQDSQAYSHFANAKASGHNYAGVMMALFYAEGLGGKRSSKIVAEALIEEASQYLSSSQINHFIANQRKSFPTVNFNGLLALLPKD